MKGKRHGNDTDWLLYLLETQHAFPWFPVPDTGSTVEEPSCSEADEPRAVITAQNVSGGPPQKQEMRENVVQSSMKRDIRSAVLEPPQDMKRRYQSGKGEAGGETHNKTPSRGSWVARQQKSRTSEFPPTEEED